jgi:hypothetical protein
MMRPPTDSVSRDAPPQMETTPPSEGYRGFRHGSFQACHAACRYSPVIVA